MIIQQAVLVKKFEIHCTTFFKIYNIQILHVIHRQHNEYVF